MDLLDRDLSEVQLSVTHKRLDERAAPPTSPTS